ncbi:sulfatase [Flavobacterium ovatum]|uniref:sulfatase family protein n=1 Tax=Flavobacterium ovatum TaxID=1928857 RepID=UPI00344C1D21
MKKTGLSITLAVLLFCQLGISQRSSNKQPNIIYIMSDDHTAQAIGAYGSRLAKLNPTPTIDKLAAEGMLFENAFVTNSICTPSRACIITGQYSQTNGVLDLDGELDPAKEYLPMEMKKLGYTTAMIGKWHLKNEPSAFDYYKVLHSQGKYFNPSFFEKGKGEWLKNEVKTVGHSTDVITDITLDYLQKRDKSKPFFIMHHYKAPHDMFEFAPRYADYLKDVEIPEPASLYFQPNFGSEATVGKNGKLGAVIGSSVSDRHLYRNYVDMLLKDTVSGTIATHLAYQEYLKRYLRCVKGVDDNLARLFDYLKKEGLWENTVIVYTGDQGMMLGEHDLIDKRWMYDESMRMPFIVHYPKMVKAGSKTDLLINNTDFAPTLIELAKGKKPSYMQGFSFINTLEGKAEKNWRTATYYRYWMHNIHHWVPAHFGVRTKQYKLIFFYAKHYLPEAEWNKFYWNKEMRIYGYNTPVAWEFYDLKNDPEEMNNRYKDPKYKDIIASLKEEILKQRKELNETDANYPEIQKVIDKHWND